MIGYYDTLKDEKLCPQCELTCLTCLNASVCETCDAGRLRVKNTTKDYAGVSDVFCPCRYGHYSLGKSDKCAACHFSCAVCDGPKDNECLFCEAAAHRTLKASKKCVCDPGYYDTNQTMNCPLCHQACDTCWDALSTTCLTCAPTFFMAEGNNTCYVKCPTYWFDNTTHMVCTSCSWHCLTCINGTNCTAC
jgi:proprotein convertase subtilisin/kexin type 5